MSTTIGTSNIKFSQVRDAIINSSCRSGPGIGNTDVTFSSFRNSLLVSSNNSFVDKNPNNPPTTRAYHSSVLTNDHKLIVFGGETNSFVLLNDTYSYDITNNTWTLLDDGTGTAPSKRAFHKCVYFNNTMYLFGGRTNSNTDDTSDQLWKFDLTNVPNTWSFISVTGTKPSKRSHHILEIYGNDIFLFGGISPSTTYNEFWKFNIVSLEWNQLASATNKERYGASSCIDADNIYIYGGLDVNNNYLNDMLKYNITTNTWDLNFYSGGTPGTNIPPKLSYTSIIPLSSNCFFIFGGRDDSVLINDIWKFLVETKTWKKEYSNPTTPSKRTGHSMVIDYFDDKVNMIVFGGENSSGKINDTYSYTLSKVFGNIGPLKISDLSGQEFY